MSSLFFFFLFLSTGKPPKITYGVALLFCLIPQQRDVFGELLFYAVIKAAGVSKAPSAIRSSFTEVFFTDSKGGT